MAKAPTTSVGLIFQLGHASTRFGEVIRVVGSGGALGDWDPSRAVALSTDAQAYPQWSTSQVVWVPARQGPLEYKYIRDKKALGEGICWEDRIANRRVALEGAQQSVYLVADDAWDCPGLPATPTVLQRSRDHSPEWTTEKQPPDDCFTPSYRAMSGERNVASVAEPLQRHGSSSLLRTPPQEEKPMMARELSILSIGVHRDCSSFSLLDEDSEDERRRNASSCSFGMPRASSSGQVEAASAGEATAPAAPEEESSGGGAFEKAYAWEGESPLGEGSFGLVWGCRQRRPAAQGPGEFRAVKRVAVSKLQPRDVRNLFGDGKREGEIKMHESLLHPHVIRLYEVFRETEIVSLVMECCQGGDLFDLIARNRTGLPEHQAAVVLRHLLEALDFLHGQFIVHRDIKCENVLLLLRDVPVERNTFKLCDFGFAARLQNQRDMLSTRMGSPDSVAPEIVRGEVYSTAVDCWASGVILYMALSAKPPFWARTDVEVLKKVRTGDYSTAGSAWEVVGEIAKDLVRSLLTFIPSSRASAQQALSHPWLAGAAAAAP